MAEVGTVLRGLISAFRREGRSWYSGDDLDLFQVATMASAAGYGLIRYAADLVTSLRKRFMKRLRRLDVPFSVDDDGSLRVAAQDRDVGDLVATFENDEISVFLGEITHSHFTPGACGDVDAQDPVEEAVSAAGNFVREILDDKWILWTTSGGMGGAYSDDVPWDDPPEGAERFRWSGRVAS